MEGALPSGERREVSLLARVKSTIGRFSNNRSKAGCGRYPTQVSVFALMSTYEPVLHNDAARISKKPNNNSRESLHKYPAIPPGFTVKRCFPSSCCFDSPLSLLDVGSPLARLDGGLFWEGVFVSDP